MIAFSKTEFSKQYRKPSDESGVYICTVMVSAEGSEVQHECGRPFKMKTGSDCFSHCDHLNKQHTISFECWKAAQVAKLQAANPTLHRFTVSQTADAYRVVIEWAVDHGVPREALLDDRFRRISHGLEAEPPKSRETLNDAVIGVSNLEKQEITTLINHQTVSLCVDGGSTHDLHTLAVVVVCKGVAYPFALMEIGSGETAESYKDIILKICADVKSSGAKVQHICTDAAAALKNGARLAAKEVGALYTICMVHCLNLVMKRILDLEASQTIIELGKQWKKWKPPVATRWWSTFDEIERAKNSDDLDLATRARMDKWLTEHVPYRISGRYMEKNCCTVGDALYKWVDLIDKTTSNLHYVYLVDRLIRVMQEEHLLLITLSPKVQFSDTRWKGPGLKSWIKGEVLPLILNLYSTLPQEDQGSLENNIDEELNEWLAGDCARTCPPKEGQSFTSYWNDTYVTDMFPRLSFVARRAGEMIASEASCERMFSQQKMVHTDVRNRLGVEQVEAEVNIRGRVGRTKRDRDQRERTTDICTTEQAVLFVKLYRLRHSLRKIDGNKRYKHVTIKESREKDEWFPKSGDISFEKFCYAQAVPEEYHGLQHLKVGSTYYLVANKGFDFKELKT